MHYSLESLFFPSTLKVTLGELRIARCLKQERAVINLSAVRTTPTPHRPPTGPPGSYACVLDCESECTTSRADRAFIYSTLKVCWPLGDRSRNVSGPPSPSTLVLSSSRCSIFQQLCVRMRNKLPPLRPPRQVKPSGDKKSHSAKRD